MALDLPASASGMAFDLRSPLSQLYFQRLLNGRSCTPRPLLGSPAVQDVCVDMDLSAKPVVQRAEQVFTPVC